ncbi:MAG: hypothetical protein QME96_10470 [Myxococcota bacterium]|nr:hypothetical protein [Myxococcota bacterium]
MALEESLSDDPAVVQNAAGKGWLAARMAAAALVECRTGSRPRGTDRIRTEVEELARRDRSLQPIRALLADAFSDLHIRGEEQGECISQLIRRRSRQIEREFLPSVRRACGAGRS